MTTRYLLILFLVLVLSTSTPTARAEPDWTRFDEVVAQSETIAIAALTERVDWGRFKAELKIHQVLKGTLKPGKYQVIVAGHYGGIVRRTREFVAFIDNGNVWRFLGFPASSKPINEDVLEIWGFNHDGDIHVVEPGLVTLAQIKTFLGNKTLRYAFRGDLYFPQVGKPGWQDSGLELSGTFDPIADNSAKVFTSALGFPSTSLARVKGFPGLAVYRAQPEVHVDIWQGPCINLEYSNDGNRVLDFRGKVVGVDPKSGEYQLKFTITQPPLLTHDDLKRYLGNVRPPTPFYTFHLKCAESGPTKARELTLVMRDQTFGQIYGWAKRPLRIAESKYGAYSNGPTAVSCLITPIPDNIRNLLLTHDWVLRMAAPTPTGEFLILAFELGEPPHDELRLDNDCVTTLLYGVFRGHTRGTLQIHDGKTLKTIAPFTVTVDPVEF
jgi:hypothetical protein